MSINHKAFGISLLLIAVLLSSLSMVFTMEIGVNTSTLIIETVFTIVMLIYNLWWFKVARILLMEDIVKGISTILMYRIATYWHVFLTCAVVGLYIGYLVFYLQK